MASMNLDFHDPSVETGSAGNPDFAVGVTGFSPYARTPNHMFRPGTLVTSANGSIWEYGTASAVVAVATPGAATPVTPTACAFDAETGVVSAGAGYMAYAPFDVGESGWVRRDGDGL